MASIIREVVIDAYTVVSGPLNAAHYNASAQVIPLGAHQCTNLDSLTTS